MILKKTDLLQLQKIAVKAAITAGTFISQRVHEEFVVKHKIGGSSLASQIVTEVDIQAQEIILSVLNDSISKYDLALLTEETEDDKSRFVKDYFWCIDPLDGTLPFTEGQPGYAVSIALVSKQGKAYVGVVYDPVHENLYTAILGNGAFKNGKRIKLKFQSFLTFAHDRSFATELSFNDDIESLKQKQVELELEKLHIIGHCGSVMNAMNVIDFAPAIYFKYPKEKPGGGSLWDFAASSCICIEAGVTVTDFYGNPLDLNRKDSTFMNHRGVKYSSLRS